MKSGKVLLVAAILSFCISLSGQSNPNTDQGLKPYDSLHGGNLDSISLTSGNLFFHHTEYAAAQRGQVGLTFSLQYNNKGFQLQTACEPPPGHQCSYMWHFVGNGMTLISDQTMGITSKHVDTGYQDQNGNEIWVYVYSAQTADGSMHPLGDTGNGFRSIDGSGILWDGSSLSAKNRSGVYVGSLGSSSVDLNGNTISTDITAHTWTDTLGRVVPWLPSPPSTSTASLSSCPNLNLTYQPVTYAYAWNPPGPTGTSPFILCFASVYIRSGMLGGGYVNSQTYHDVSTSVTFLQSVVQPDGTAWTFTYDGANPNDTTSIAYGDLLEIGFPTGGSISYTYATEIGYQGYYESGMITTQSRSVTSRTVNANDGTGPHTWNYNWGSPTVATSTAYMVENTVTDPLGNDAVHQITGLYGGPSLFETQTRYYQGSKSSGTLLKTVNTDYNYSENPFDQLGPTPGPPTGMNVEPIRVTTILPNGLTAKEEKDYDSGFSFRSPLWGTSPAGVTNTNITYPATLSTITAQREYDYGQGSAGNLLRQTLNTYLWQGNSNYLTANMLDLPSSVVVQDGNGNRVAETDSTYDESSYLTSSGVTTQHGSPAASVRGNLTSVSKWLNTGGTVVTHANWYDTGEVYQAIDALGNTTTHSYDPAYAGAYSTKTCNPLGQCVSGTYDFNSGLLTSFTDANGSPANGNTQGDPAHTSNYSYDNMFRMTQALSPPDANGQRPETDFYYPNATTVERRRKFDSNNNWITDYAYFDGLGRTIQTRLVDPEGDDYVDTSYDVLGRVSTVSNPHRSSSSQTDGTTTTYYDALGRVTQTTKQDGSFSLVKYDLQTGNANCTLATDETGKPRYACNDALGRVLEVQEPSAASVFTPSWSRVLQQWGAPGDIPVPGDYDGDGITDFAIWRPSTGTWWVMRSSDGTIITQQWGNQASGDVPVPGDYDGDGKTDYAVWRASTGTWLVLRSSDGGTTTQQWGNQASGDVPVPGDYDGDRNTDFAVWRASTGTWYVLRSSDGGTTTQQWGNQSSGDTPVPGDYDGDRKTDFAVWRSSTGVWYVLRSSDAGTTTQSWGISGDKPAQGDYDGDGKTDFAVWRPSTATWYLVRSSDGRQVSEQWGTNGDMPVAASFQGGGQADFAVWNPTTGMWSVSLSYLTQYSYDTLGNLIQVNQQGDGSQAARVRTFTYDSLSRLLAASNPESGTISYSYDADGNVLQKTSPAPNQTGTATQTISYCYDKLNRITGKQYAATSCPLSSPVVTYTYDAGTSGIGHLTSLTDQAGSGSYSFDALGRITSEQRTIGGIQKSLSYTYFLDNSINTLTYPSGAVLRYSDYTASGQTAGRLGSVVDSGNSVNYVTGTGGSSSYATHTPDGSLTSYVSGYSSSFNGIANNFTYNKRLQPVTMLATKPNNQAVFSISYDFHLGNGDNGNVYAITNNRDSSRSQTFTYDALNRLASARNAGSDCSKKTANNLYEYWGNTYGYDPWGNLTNKTVMSNVNPATCAGESLNVGPASAKNQLPGYSYDAAGNMTHDATSGLNYTYDQENRITGAAGYTYTYDADGNRVEKSNGSTGTIYWYMTPGIVGESDPSGNLQSEYVFFDGERAARRDNPSNSGPVSYYFSDHLKTTSVITNSAGTITEDEDYYPWGGELQFVNNDSNHYKFTGKERDSETGLDYFGARYYGNWLGRWMSPDWASKPEAVPYSDLHDPQSLNLYSYVRNIPTVKIDADGHCVGDDCSEIQVKAEVTQQPVVISTRSGKTDSAVAGGEVTYTFTYSSPPYNSRPLSNTSVHEVVKNTYYENGHQTPVPTYTRDDKTDSNGKVPDESGIVHKEPNASGTGSNKASDFLSQNVLEKDTKQTLTFSSPSGSTCTVTETRTMTNATPDGKASSSFTIKLTSPQVQTAKPRQKTKKSHTQPTKKR